MTLRTGILNPLGNVYTTAWYDYSATSTVVGWTSFTAKQIYIKKLGKLVFVEFNIAGTSDATTVTFTIPYTSSALDRCTCAFTVDSGTATTTGGKVYLDASTATVGIFLDMRGTAWTNSGTKKVTGQLFYECV